MQNTLFVAILVIIIADYLFERLIDYLNSLRWNETIPGELQGIYEQEQYKKSQQYHKVNHRFSAITSTVSFIVVVVMLLESGFAWVDRWTVSISSQFILNPLIFFAILGLASGLINLPFSVYDTFVIEEKFGFNKTTPKLFVMDTLKGWLLTALLGGAVLSLIIWVWTKTGQWFWLWAWGILTLISLVFSMFYSNLIVPLFNKQTPLPKGELKDEINRFALNAGFKLKDIYVIDGSKRSTKANAYFTGLGPKKRIVLYDTLTNDLTNQEIVAVLAHEIGHYKKKHTQSALILSILETGLMLFIFSWLASNPVLSQALGVESPKFHIAMIAFGILYSPLSFLLGIGTNSFSRHNEYQADAFAATFGLKDSLVSGLKKLTTKNLGNLTPHPAYVFFHYSHPTLLQRIQKLNTVTRSVQTK